MSNVARPNTLIAYQPLKLEFDKFTHICVARDVMIPHPFGVCLLMDTPCDRLHAKGYLKNIEYRLLVDRHHIGVTAEEFCHDFEPMAHVSELRMTESRRPQSLMIEAEMCLCRLGDLDKFRSSPIYRLPLFQFDDPEGEASVGASVREERTVRRLGDD